MLTVSCAVCRLLLLLLLLLVFILLLALLYRRFQECLWGSERKVADVDTQGVEDPKLFVWPGKGVYAVFGRKPEALGASPYCKDPIFVQFLVQVRVVLSSLLACRGRLRVAAPPAELL